MTGPQASPELHAALLRGSAAEQEIQNITDEAERLMAGGSPVPEQGDEETGRTAKASGTGRVSWPMMTFILLGDMFGLGTLTLPGDFARLGWVLAVAMMVLCLAGVLYSGRVFTLLAAQVPSARVFDDYGQAALGKTGRRLVYVCIYTTILLTPVILHLTCVESLQQIFYHRGISRLAGGGIVAAIILPLAQVQGLEDVAVLSSLGTLGMLVAVGVAVGKLVVMDAPIKPTELIHRPSNVTTPVVALLDIVFTYGGQVNWVRYITQMRVRRHFPRSVVVTGFLMTAAYVLMGAVGYLRLGTDFDSSKPITSILPQDRLWSPIMNAGLFLHCILAYQINMNVWTDVVLHLVAPVASWPEAKLHDPGWLIWGLVSGWGVATCFLAAAIFPFFSTVAAVIASLGDLSGAYALPAIFLLTLAGSTLGRWERGVLKTIIPLTIAMSVIGLVCSINSLILEVQHKT